MRLLRLCGIFRLRPSLKDDSKPCRPETKQYNLAKNNLTEAERGDERRSISQRKRKLVEKVFGWAKVDSVLRQVKVRGLKRVDWFYRFAMAAYNFMRLRRLIPIQPAA